MIANYRQGLLLITSRQVAHFDLLAFLALRGGLTLLDCTALEWGEAPKVKNSG